MKSLIFPLILLSFLCSYAQSSIEQKEYDTTKTTKSTKTIQKGYNTTKINETPTIDGVLDDPIWNTLPELGNFTMFDPENGTPELDTHKTKVKIGYTDDAIYVAVYMYDDEPDKILRQFSQRDQFNTQADFFTVILNTYNNSINETKFLVTSAGTLADATSENGRDDWSWNTVFKAEISFDDKGWYAEYRIPYSALRFPEKKEQLWGLQFYRQIKHLNVSYSWNYIDKSIGNESQYNGLLTGIKDITPPTRLSFYPFAAVNQEFFDGDNETTFSAGMDIKYGISDSFTLDATLIPDFGQAKFDDVTLNLGPFEQTFSENRAFFTEGTELFNKGGLFYSRRVGNTPSAYNKAYDNLGDNETIVENPESVKLLNAIKVSGRTKDGLGIGFFNSITQKTEAKIADEVTGEHRKIITEPTTNYNVFVLDQQLKNSSSISLVNTNVTRNGHYRDANVSALLFGINNKKRSFKYSGKAVISQVNDTENNKPGFSSKFDIDRTKGRFRYAISNSIANKTYDINDLGISREINYNNSNLELSYENFEPTKKLNKYRINGWLNHNRRLIPSIFVNNSYGVGFFASTINRLSFGGHIRSGSKYKDFYEPRAEDRFFEQPSMLGSNIWISTDFRKKFAIESNINISTFFDSEKRGLYMRVEPRYRFSNQFSLIYAISHWNGSNEIGYVNTVDDSIIMGQRDVKNFVNSITASYNFSSKQAINFSLRNYWSTANYFDNKYGSLNTNGTLSPFNYDTVNNDHNTNFNIWNIDLTYNWRFAPGSEAILLYRNKIFNQDKFAERNFTDSADKLFKQPIQHNISLKVVYYLDYNNIKGLLKKSNS